MELYSFLMMGQQIPYNDITLIIKAMVSGYFAILKTTLQALAETELNALMLL